MAASEPSIRPHLGLRQDTEKADFSANSPALTPQEESQELNLDWPNQRCQTTRRSIIVNSAKKRRSRSEQIQHEFRRLSTIAFTSLVMGTWEILLTASASALLNGGLAGMFWSVVWCYIGQLFLILSLAEMSSMVPLAGGQYHWVREFAPQRYKDLLSYCSGWFCSIGWQARFAVDCYIIAGIIEALIEVNNPGFVSTYWHHNILMIVAALSVSAFNTFAAGHLSIAEGVFALAHIFALVPIVVSMWVLAPKHTVVDVLARFTDNGGGWPSIGLSVLVGQASSFFIVMGSDAVAHISDEVEEPGVIVPQCMFWSYLANIPLAITTLVTYAFNVGRVELAVNDTLPPFIYMFRQAFDFPGATTGFAIVVLFLMTMVAVSTMVSTSRHLFVFGRDLTVHCPNWISKVQPTLQVPLNTIISTNLFVTVVSLVMVGSDSIQRSMIGLSSLALHATYIICIGCLLRKRLHHETLPSASWSLGNYGLGINVLALIYSMWCFVWSCIPSYYNVTASNFNWAMVFFVIVVILALGSYASGAKSRKKLVLGGAPNLHT